MATFYGRFNDVVAGISSKDIAEPRQFLERRAIELGVASHVVLAILKEASAILGSSLPFISDISQDLWIPRENEERESRRVIAISAVKRRFTSSQPVDARFLALCRRHKNGSDASVIIALLPVTKYALSLVEFSLRHTMTYDFS